MTEDEIKTLLGSMTIDELSYTLGRYTGPSNFLLAEKKFGRSLDREEVQRYYEKRVREFYDKEAEKFLLSDDPTTC